jgi:archaetidylinositol phosphate synthase
MRMEAMAGKAATRQASLGGFETEDLLYLLPLVTLCDGIVPFLLAASIFAPLFAIWMVLGYLRALRRQRSMMAAPTPGVAQ